MINRLEFYRSYRRHLVNKISQTQVNGFEAVFNAVENYKSDPQGEGEISKFQLAYILATAFHETGRKSMEPVREGFKETDQDARAHVQWLFDNGYVSRNYALPHPETGLSYYGRGIGQITHFRNYLKLSERMGLGRLLVDDPDILLKRLDLSARSTVIGMMEGLFTGRKLGAYIHDNIADYHNARRVYNGLDKAKLIASHAMKFEKCLMYGDPNE